MEEINREVGEIHTKVDHLIKLVEKQNSRVSTLEGEVSSLRRWQAAVVGGFTAIGTGIGAFLTKMGL